MTGANSPTANWVSGYTLENHRRKAWHIYIFPFLSKPAQYPPHIRRCISKNPRLAPRQYIKSYHTLPLFQQPSHLRNEALNLHSLTFRPFRLRRRHAWCRFRELRQNVLRGNRRRHLPEALLCWRYPTQGGLLQQKNIYLPLRCGVQEAGRRWCSHRWW